MYESRSDVYTKGVGSVDEQAIIYKFTQIRLCGTSIREPVLAMLMFLDSLNFNCICTYAAIIMNIFLYLYFYHACIQNL